MNSRWNPLILWIKIIKRLAKIPWDSKSKTFPEKAVFKKPVVFKNKKVEIYFFFLSSSRRNANFYISNLNLRTFRLRSVDYFMFTSFKAWSSHANSTVRTPKACWIECGIVWANAHFVRKFFILFFFFFSLDKCNWKRWLHQLVAIVLVD